ncbi:MAG: hypothetical protein ACLPRW_13825, partial [Mycobacterium sp.]
AGVAFDDDERDAVGTGNSAKAHSPELSGGRERGEAGRSGPTPKASGCRERGEAGRGGPTPKTTNA